MRLSGIFSALFLLAFMLVASSLVEQMSLATLAGVMFMVVIRAFAWQSATILRQISLTDALVMVLVTIFTVLTDLAIAVIVNVIVLVLAYAWNNATRIHASTKETVEGGKIY